MAEQHVDYSVLATLREVMEGEYRALLDVFLEDSAGRVEKLQEKLQALTEASDPEPALLEISMLAHSFKGSSSNMGALRLTELSRQLEELARSKPAASNGQVQQLIVAVASEYQVVSQLFDLERQSLISPH